MGRDKQIEEMAKDCPCYYGGECIIDNELPEKCDRFCQFGTYAEILYNAGYRKASEVAREIFEELETKAPWFCENQTAYEHFNEELAELKKKYTVTDTNVGCKAEEGK